ncbi:MAG TPA: acylphosphatase [Chitinophagaceae bacterium]|nr:acylphosphatase [Chitinophagaceae bacterium]
MKTVRLTIKGKVQGVFYRATAKDVAEMLGIKGWIRNLPDNNVEITATAAENVLQKFIGWCKQGPPKAKVDEVIVEELDLQVFNDFRINR